MMGTIWRWLAKAGRRESAACACGGRIYEHLSWGDAHYFACDACQKEISAAEFARRKV